MHTTLFVHDGAGAYRPATVDELAAGAAAMFRRDLEAGEITSPRAAQAYMQAQLGSLEHEVFACLFLDTQHRVLALEELFRGTIDGAAVYPREVVKRALAHNAAAVILAHNHPSGFAEPSNADRQITTRLRDALALIDVRVLDHLVLTATEVTSFASRGLL